MNHPNDGDASSMDESNERDRSGLSRRSVMKAAGAAGAASLVPFAGVGTAGRDTSTIDDAFDLSTVGLKEALVVFDARDAMARLTDDLTLQGGIHEFSVLPITYTELTSKQIRTVADWESVRRVRKSVELEYFNDDSTAITHANAVQQDLSYDGSGVDAVVIDSGFSGPHPDFDGRLESNWQWVDNPLGTRDADWVNAGSDADTDDLGHGTHCSGILAGDGSASDGTYAGMAPGTTLSVYSTNETVYLPYAIGAWDHMLARKADPEVDFDPVVASNSYGVARDIRYNPNDPLNVATWEAFQRGMVPVFAAGNSGPDPDTLSRFAKAPHVVCVAATRDDKHVTGFSSRGRTPDEDRATNYDRKRALDNLEKFHAAMTNGERGLDDGTWSGTLGPTGTGSDFFEWEAPKRADVLELTLHITPDGEQISLTIHQGSKEGTEIAKLGEEPVYQHHTLTTDVEGGETYWIEVEPATNVAVDYTVGYEGYEQVRGEPDNYRPVGLYRPAVGTPGNAVVSTFGPTDPLDALDPDTKPYYGAISGTSMACPAAAGICTLIIDATREHGYDPSPAEVITTLEATAYDAHASYTPWNIGTGFVDALAAVKRAEAGDFARFNEVELVEFDT
jgi:serine protease AprX